MKKKLNQTKQNKTKRHIQKKIKLCSLEKKTLSSTTFENGNNIRNRTKHKHKRRLPLLQLFCLFYPTTTRLAVVVVHIDDN